MKMDRSKAIMRQSIGYFVSLGDDRLERLFLKRNKKNS